MDFSSSTERVLSLAERAAYLRYSINLRLFNWRVPGLVEDEQQWGLEQCGCRQETEVELARKSIGFLPTITSNSSSNGREQFLQREHNHNFNSRGEFLAATVQTTRRDEFLPEALLPLSFLRNGSNSVATRFTSRRNCYLYTILMPPGCGEDLATFLFELRASFFMNTPL